MESNGHIDDVTVSVSDEWDVSGERLEIPEALVVAPARGRLRREALEVGAVVARGALLGRVDRSDGHDTTPIVSPADGVLLGWLAWEGESVQRGALLARIGSPALANSNGNGNGNGTRPGSGGRNDAARSGD